MPTAHRSARSQPTFGGARAAVVLDGRGRRRPRWSPLAASVFIHALVCAAAALLVVSGTPPAPHHLTSRIETAPPALSDDPPLRDCEMALPPRPETQVTLLPEPPDEVEPIEFTPEFVVEGPAEEGPHAFDASVVVRVRSARSAAPSNGARIELPVAAAPDPPRDVAVAPARFTPPRPLPGGAAPRYPSMALRRGWRGIVRLLIRITERGDVGEVGVIESSGYPVLDDAAVAAARTWRFEPARRGDLPVPAAIAREVRFEF